MEEVRIQPIAPGVFKKRDRIILRQRLLDKTRGNGGIEYPAEGGILTYFVGEKYPVKGIMLVADETILDVVDRVKAGLLRALRFTISKPLVFFLPLMLPFYRPILKSALYQLADFSQKSLNNFYLADDKWCQSGREILRVLKDNTKWDAKYGWQSQLWMALLMVVEFSDGYRHRLQDIFGELDKKALKENPRKELLRLMDLLIVREQGEGMKQKWRDFRKPIGLLMWIFRGKIKKIAEILMELNLDEIRSDEGDIYHQAVRSDYNYQGKSFICRIEERQIIDKS